MSETLMIRPSSAALVRSRPRRWLEAMRSFVRSPLSIKDKALADLFSDGVRSAAGVPVNEISALNYSAFWCAVNVIATDVASLPLFLYRRLPGGGKERYTGHGLFELLHDAPNPEMSSFTFRETLQAHALTWGNGYAEIEPDQTGRPVALWPLLPNTVQPYRDPRGELYYRVTNPDGTQISLEAKRVIHLSGLGFDGICGYSVVQKMREAIGLGLAGEKFGASFYGNGSTFGGVLTTNLQLGPEEEQALRSSIEKFHMGPERAHRFLMLWGGMDYKKLGIDPNAAQFIESRQFQVIEMCRTLRLSPTKLQDYSRATFSNVEETNIAHVIDCVRPWCVKWEQELNRKLISPLERKTQFAEHLIDGLLRGDIVKRSTALGIQRDKGIINADEWREIENQNPQPGGQGKTYLVQQAMIPADKLSELVESQIDSNKAQADRYRQPPPPQQLNGSQTEPPSDTGATARAEAAEAEAAKWRLKVDEAREARIAAEATGAATAEALAAARAHEADLVAQAQQFTLLAQELTARSAQERADIEAARQAAFESERAMAEAIASRDAARSGAETAEARATAAAEAEQVAAEALAAARAEAEQARSAAAALEATFARLETERASAEEAREAMTLSATDAEARASAYRVAAEVAQADRSVSEQARGDAERAAAEAGDVAAEATRRAEAADTAAREAAAALETARSAEAAAMLAAETHAASISRLEAELSAASQQALDLIEARDLAMAEASDCRAKLEQLSAELAQAKVAQTALSSDLDAAKSVQTALKSSQEVGDSAVISAHRQLVLHVMRGAIEREVDRVQRNQQTGQKLRAFVETWYDGHAELMVEHLIPAVTVHLAWIGSSESAGDVARRLVEEHVETSRRQLQAVLDGDAGALAWSVARLLKRWEAERITVIADRLMAAEVEYVKRRHAA